jgi:hypothetical protein
MKAHWIPLFPSDRPRKSQKLLTGADVPTKNERRVASCCEPATRAVMRTGAISEHALCRRDGCVLTGEPLEAG